jgi:hypothetical protein
MRIKIPNQISITDYNNQELYFIGLFTELKLEGRYKFKKINRLTVQEKMLDYEKHLQSLVNKKLIKIVAEDDLSFTYCLTIPIQLDTVKQVDITLLTSNPTKPFPFVTDNYKHKFNDIAELKAGYNHIEDQYIKLLGMYKKLKEVFEFTEKQSKN